MIKLKKTSRNGVLVLIAVMILTIPNMPVYSAVGSYQSNSMALAANKNYNATAMASDKVIWPALLLVAAGLGLAVVGAVGVIDGWNSIHAKLRKTSSDFEKNYDKYDFSRFDN
jgi:hypothetical protein